MLRLDLPDVKDLLSLGRLAFVCLVENIVEVVFVCLVCFFLLCFIRFYLTNKMNHSSQVGGHKVQSRYLHFHILGPGEDPGTAEIVSRRKWGK